jgi:hypothetical protein
VNELGFPASRRRRLRFDTDVPNVARIYDVLLGGKDNFAADRAAAEELLKAVPGATAAARENRAFLGRAVRFLAGEAGIRQFLDIGAGLPAAGNVHEIAREADPLARVVYTDCDPVVVLHANVLLANTVTVAAVDADLRYPEDLLGSPGVRALIDFDQPVAVLLVAVLHFVEDGENPQRIVNYIKERLAPGSYLAVSHVTGDDLAPEARQQAQAVYENASAPGVARARDDIARFFDGLVMLAPGLVNVRDWRPDRLARSPGETLFYAGIGRKPASPRESMP